MQVTDRQPWRAGSRGGANRAAAWRWRGAVLALACLAGPMSAAGGFVAPEGCESFMTIQSEACSVAILWRCDGARPGNSRGDFWEANFSRDGLESIVSYDGEYQWLDAAYSWDSSREAFSPPAVDRISRRELLDTGIDTFDFTMRRVTPERRYDIRVVGADMLTGETETIDGFTLEEVSTRLEIIDDEGTVEYASKGMQYYSRELGLFFLGSEEVYWPDGEVSVFEDRPADIILPGEPGFEDTNPLYGCVLQDAAFPPTAPVQAEKETNDDQI